MPNTILTIDMITREAVRLFRNTNAFIQALNHQYDSSFAVDGAKIGDTLRIRLPNDYTVRTGAAASVQSTTEQSTTLTLATQKGVDVSFSTAERTLELDDYSERVMAPMINVLGGAVAMDVMSGVEGGVCNIVANQDGANTIINPAARTYLNAGAALASNSAPMMNRQVVNNQFTEAAVVSTLSGLLNPSEMLSRQYQYGKMYTALGFDWLMDQTVLVHTNGTFSAGGTVNGASQTGTTLTVNATTGTFEEGDIITISGVNAVNRVTKASTGQLRQFVITADAASGATSLSIYPAIVAGGGSYDPLTGDGSAQYQTVTASPANGATVAFALSLAASAQYRKNIAFSPEAITMATADLVMPTKGVEESARDMFDSIAMRMITQYAIGTDQLITRLDVLYGYLFIRPEWAVVVADSL